MHPFQVYSLGAPPTTPRLPGGRADGQAHRSAQSTGDPCTPAPTVTTPGPMAWSSRGFREIAPASGGSEGRPGPGILPEASEPGAAEQDPQPGLGPGVSAWELGPACCLIPRSWGASGWGARALCPSALALQGLLTSVYSSTFFPLPHKALCVRNGFPFQFGFKTCGLRRALGRLASVWGVCCCGRET